MWHPVQEALLNTGPKPALTSAGGVTKTASNAASPSPCCSTSAGVKLGAGWENARDDRFKTVKFPPELGEVGCRNIELRWSVWESNIPAAIANKTIAINLRRLLSRNCRELEVIELQRRSMKTDSLGTSKCWIGGNY